MITCLIRTMYESDDKRWSQVLNVPRLSNFAVPGSSTSTSCCPLATSTLPRPRLLTAHTDLFIENEDDPSVPAQLTPPTQPRPNPPPQAPAVSWVTVYDGEPELDVRYELAVRNPGPHDCPADHTPFD